MSRNQRPSYIALPILLEERPDYENLKPTQADDENALDDAEPNDSRFRGPDGGKVAVFARAKVLLHACCKALARQGKKRRGRREGGKRGRGAVQITDN